jgi:hypothetical protein
LSGRICRDVAGGVRAFATALPASVEAATSVPVLFRK